MQIGDVNLKRRNFHTASSVQYPTTYKNNEVLEMKKIERRMAEIFDVKSVDLLLTSSRLPGCMAE